MERTLILMRHGKSDWSTGRADLERPLGDRGRRQAAEAGRWLAEHHPAVDLAVVSTAVRARQTWELVAEQLDPAPETIIDERIYDGSLAEVVTGLPEAARTVLIVGHNPGMEELIAHLTGDDVRLVTSAMAILGLSGWRGHGVLHAVGRPPEPGA